MARSHERAPHERMISKSGHRVRSATSCTKAQAALSIDGGRIIPPLIAVEVMISADFDSPINADA
jgi:hypothetical protein